MGYQYVLQSTATKLQRCETFPYGFENIPWWINEKVFLLKQVSILFCIFVSFAKIFLFVSLVLPLPKNFIVAQITIINDMWLTPLLCLSTKGD